MFTTIKRSYWEGKRLRWTSRCYPEFIWSRSFIGLGLKQLGRWSRAKRKGAAGGLGLFSNPRPAEDTNAPHSPPGFPVRFLGNPTRRGSLDRIEHPSETKVFHNEDGNPARANIKQALGYLKDGDGDGNSQHLRYQNTMGGYKDAGYMSDPHTGRSQPEYVFTGSNAAISWRFIKQTMSATSSNHAKILSIHEVSQESLTVVHEDNAACIAQLKDEYIKGDQPSIFYRSSFSLVTCRGVATYCLKVSFK
ncbi:hypothetical protein Tco_0941246 [Tanacetum coccineum]|uniref:Uncharacterized protein n=1 Tax=Tanacetum coccineum TaxID=301880 RepID=A0ABQ5DQC2_9ASTR